MEVDYLLSGRAADAYFDMQAFGSYRALPGLTFASRDGELDLWQTLKQNQPRRFWQDLSTLELDGYDRVVSDFEPVTAWAARRKGIRTLGISHQASFNYPIPRKGEDIASRLVMRHYAPVDQAIGLHWFHFGHPILPPVVIGSPFVRRMAPYWSIYPSNRCRPSMICSPAIPGCSFAVFILMCMKSVPWATSTSSSFP